MDCISFLELDQKTRNFCVFGSPMKIGNYGVRDRLYQFDDGLEDIYFYYDPTEFTRTRPLNSNVLVDRNLFTTKHDKELRLNTFLDYIYNNRELFKSPMKSANLNENLSSNASKKRLIDVDFVTVRGTLHSMMKTVYRNEDEYVLLAERFGGTIYLFLDKKQADYSSSEEVVNSKYKVALYATKCLNPKLTRDLEFCEPNSMKTVEEPEANVREIERRKRNDLFFVYQNQIGPHSLIYSARMNCFANDNSLEESDCDLIEAIEMKRSKIPEGELAIDNFYSRKIFDWWAHSVLINAKVCVTFWNDDNIVRRIKEYKLSDLKRLGKKRVPRDFDKDVCFANLSLFLSFVKQSFDKLDQIANKEIEHRGIKSNDIKNIDLLRFEYKKKLNTITCKLSNTELLFREFREEFATQD